MQRRPWFLACLALACSSSALEDGSDTGGASGSGGSGGSGEPTPECEAPGYPTSAEQEDVGSVQATVLDLDGNPAPAGLLVQVCGLDVCINGETDSAGYAQVDVGGGIKVPAFKYGDGLTFAKIALSIDAPVTLNLGELYLPALPAEGAAITAGATASSGGAELTVAEGASIVFDRLTYRTDDEQAFRAAELPIDLAPAGLSENQDFEIFYALGPLDTEFCPPAELTLPNSAGLEPGSEVEFYLLGLDVQERYAPYAGFAQFAEGTVSEDGSVVRTTAGGLPSLSLVGVTRKP